MYRLTTAPVVVKVARPDTHHMPQIVALVRWLQTHGVPTVPLLEVDQPITVNGYHVTLWRYLPQTRPILAGDIAEPLAVLHHLPTPPSVTLPHLDALTAIRHSIERSRILTTTERVTLQNKWKQLNDQVPELKFQHPPQLLHGDPQHRNMLWNHQTNQPVLCDWDGAVIGPVEWDLVTIEIHCRRFGHPPHEYHKFCTRYGTDIRNWTGYHILRDLRELRMITTNARKSPTNSKQAREVHHRIRQLNAGPDQRWNIL